MDSSGNSTDNSNSTNTAGRSKRSLIDLDDGRKEVMNELVSQFSLPAAFYSGYSTLYIRDL